MARRALAPLAIILALPLAPLVAQVASGSEAWAAGRYADAQTAYEQALRADSTSVRALYRLAVLASWRNQLDSSLTLIRRGRAVEPADPDVRLLEAQVLAWQGHYAAATVRYDSLMTSHPARAEPYFGRAQIARWTGHSREAARWVARALAADSTNRDARSLGRDLHATRAPQADASAGWSNDSDRNTSWSQSLTLSASAAGGDLRAFVTGGVQESRDPVRHASRLLGETGVRVRSGALSLNAAAGVRQLRPDAAADRSVFTYRGGVRLDSDGGFGVGASFAHAPIDETAFLIGSGLDIDAADGSLDLRLTPRLALSAGGGAAWISDGNHRASGIAVLNAAAGHGLTFGLMGRLLDYERRGVGYFSPDRFSLAEARAAYSVGAHGWEARLGGGAGVQKIRGADTQAEWHVESRVARRWGPVGLAELFGGVTNSAASSVTGAFRYRFAGLRLVITF